MTNKRKGFTLVELLIVIVVIGILSAMMMLSSTESVASAKANNIISNLRNLKTAVLSWYTDNIYMVVKVGNDYKIKTDTKTILLSEFVKNNGSEFLKYLNNETSITLGNKDDKNNGHYLLTGVMNAKKWYVCYNLGASDKRVKEKLTSKAKSVGLKGAAPGVGGGNEELSEYNGNDVVCMLVLTLEE